MAAIGAGLGPNLDAAIGAGRAGTSASAELGTRGGWPRARRSDAAAQDLYARLAGFETVLPALRDRLEDLGTLIAAILPRVAPEPRPHHPRSLRRPRPVSLCLAPQHPRARASAARRRRPDQHRRDPARVPLRSDPHLCPAAAVEPEDRTLREFLIKHLHEHAGNVGAVGRAMGKADADPPLVPAHADRAIAISETTSTAW